MTKTAQKSRRKVCRYPFNGDNLRFLPNALHLATEVWIMIDGGLGTPSPDFGRHRHLFTGIKEQIIEIKHD
jgi:hypothetical protein